MSRRIPFILVVFLTVAAISSVAQTRSGHNSTIGPARSGELVFVPVKIDGPKHDPANHTFWFGPFAECSSVLDINGDGKLDIAAGRNYYIAPKWTKYSDYRDGAATNGPDVDDNFEGTMDVNNYCRMDVICSGWMQSVAFGSWTRQKMRSSRT